MGVGRDHISNSGARLLKMGGVGEAEGVANDAVELLSLWKTRHRVNSDQRQREGRTCRSTVHARTTRTRGRVNNGGWGGRLIKQYSCTEVLFESVIINIYIKEK